MLDISTQIIVVSPLASVEGDTAQDIGIALLGRAFVSSDRCAMVLYTFAT